MSLTCTKAYRDIPFAHRQHLHDGHCAWIHGHNWSFIFTFACERLDENGFVVDFGKLEFLREWIDRNFDHACVFNESDPMREALLKSAPEAWKALVVENCSSEGLACHLHACLDPLVRERTAGRVRIVAVEVREDTRNGARYAPEEG